MSLNYFFCVSVIIFALIAICCEFNSNWHVQATYGLMMISTSLMFYLMDPPLERHFLVVMFPRALACLKVALCFTCIDFLAVMFWSLICMLAECWKLFRLIDGQPGQDGSMFIAIACLLYIVTLLVSALMRERTRAALHQDFAWKAYRLEQSASNLLLEHFCDAVLPADAELHINGCADRFAAMLMLDSKRCQEGTNVQEFMPLEDDRELFRKHFCSPSARLDLDPVPQVSCLNVHLRDGSGNQVRAEVVGVAFKNFNNDVNYKFGVRESLDGQSFPIRELGGHETRSRRPYSGSCTLSAAGVEDMDDQSSASTLSRPSYTLSRLAQTYFVETSLRGQVLSLVRLMATLNLETSWRKCCTYHSYLPQLRRLLDDLRSAPCKEGIHHNVRSQCNECGVLDTFDDIWSLVGWARYISSVLGSNILVASQEGI
eukprot:TRINITY_DN4462_c0_g6_i1.p1 TRINITY_DN4462_c0_g6~~TRINITY_DN4462_c0_g6_i1.p1  ORF type:complete len:430 (+),score=43.21 TRINITY_DN4462_c0_g6_i1:68-1357(+)